MFRYPHLVKLSSLYTSEDHTDKNYFTEMCHLAGQVIYFYVRGRGELGL